MVRVLVADDQAVVRKGIRVVLDPVSDFEVVGEAEDGDHAVRQVIALRPDVVLMDIQMPGSGIAATRRLAEHSELDVRVLMLTTFDVEEYVFDSLRAGASGFLLKDVEPENLIYAVRSVYAGGTVLDPAVTGRVVDRLLRRDTAPVRAESWPDRAEPGHFDVIELTPREREVVRLIARGRSNAEIASILQLSRTTVKTHVASALSKWNLRDRVQLVVRAFETGLAQINGNENCRAL
ncbi:response regulator [Saccharopolyspora spinosa]|uniref:LuxR family two component transcriptional regulator n=1 Tax=Saccharopolyspora spinosa TaxID=60894 RepID=A0A2N3XZK2_SACSN|nr:response regulator transcription factor [Saccharopolyspora spinosa]PKW16095.1 LuxR family two component transcriptional regulator [Saccharopolyspora spinosa]